MVGSADVAVSLNYLAPEETRPVYIASAQGVAEHDVGVRFKSQRVTITDARGASPSFALDTSGFALASHQTAVSDFYDLDIPAYEIEIRELVLAATGGRETVVFDHTLRSDSPLVRGHRSTREPAWFVHNDYTPGSARRRLEQHCEGAADYQPFAIVNVWRTISGPVVRTPVACCDARSVSEADVVAAERRAGDAVGELEFARWNADHCWYYFPAMDYQEALLIKTFDSRGGNFAGRCLHSAFDNPNVSKDAPARESIESRLLVLF